MASSGPRYPGTTGSEQGPSGDNDWISTSPISADDGSEAQITAATFDAGDQSYRLQATNFGFAIPAGSPILGILVEIDRRCFAGTATDAEVQLYDSTGTLVGANKAAAGNWPATLTVASYGGAADTWTAGLDTTDINSANFGVALIVNATGANTDIGVDFIRVTVTFTPKVGISAGVTPSGAFAKEPHKPLGGGLSFSAALTALRKISKALTGGLTFSAGLVRRAGRGLTGGLSFSAAMDPVKHAGEVGTPALTARHIHPGG